MLKVRSIRPDGKLVVTWSRHADRQGNPGQGTVLGFSVAEVWQTYCPTDLNCNGYPADSDDFELFQGIVNNYDPQRPHPLADWNCNGYQGGPTEFTAFQNTAINFGCQP
jgi:hypothetical protein